MFYRADKLHYLSSSPIDSLLVSLEWSFVSFSSLEAAFVIFFIYVILISSGIAKYFEIVQDQKQ